jgi:hypothetical protein
VEEGVLAIRSHPRARPVPAEVEVLEELEAAVPVCSASETPALMGLEAAVAAAEEMGRVLPTIRTLVSAERGEMARLRSDLPHPRNQIERDGTSVSIRPDICVQASLTPSERGHGRDGKSSGLSSVRAAVPLTRCGEH